MTSSTQPPRIVVLTGAGISAESGLKNFRDNDGLWENHRVEEVATPQAFDNDPSLVYRFYNARRKQLQESAVQPNLAHEALAMLEKHFADNLLLVTQNVDDLHERGGSQRVLHMHGELLSARCNDTGETFRWAQAFDQTTPCPCCQKGTLRPDIVWFGKCPCIWMKYFTRYLMQIFLLLLALLATSILPQGLCKLPKKPVRTLSKPIWRPVPLIVYLMSH